MQTPLVIIKCLVYNHEPYLRQCLDGFVMQQTNFPFYAVVHDDVSTDNSAAIIREYAEKYPDIIHPIYETENQYSKGDGSLGRIMNEACKDAKYIALCEGDDYWTDPLKLQKQVDFLEANPEYGLCYTDFDMYNPQTNERVTACFESGKFLRSIDFMDHLLTKGYIAPMTWVYRAELGKQIDTHGFSDGTFAMALDFYQLTKVKYLNKVTATYQLSANSVTRNSNPQKQIAWRRGLLDIQLHYLRKYNLFTNDIACNLKMQHYIDLLPSAIENSFDEIVSEAQDYFLSQRINIAPYVGSLKTLKHYKFHYYQVQLSYAYRIGKTFVRPLVWLKKMFLK